MAEARCAGDTAIGARGRGERVTALGTIARPSMASAVRGQGRPLPQTSLAMDIPGLRTVVFWHNTALAGRCWELHNRPWPGSEQQSPGPGMSVAAPRTSSLLWLCVVNALVWNDSLHRGSAVDMST